MFFWNKKPTADDIMARLKDVHHPKSGRDIVALGMVAGAHVNVQGEAVISITVDPREAATLEPLRQEAERAVSQIRKLKKVHVVLTAERPPTDEPPPADTQSKIPDPHGMAKNPKLAPPIKHIIAVASGKGGVGKSMVASNLAVSLAKAGFKTGLLDADVYGPSQPHLMGVEGHKPGGGEGDLIPVDAHGVMLMSMGFLVDAKKALVWRGPMVQSAIYQMLRDVAWGTEDDKLDILIVDMPPGTGDAQLTMAQKVPLTGAVIVSTPQDIALLDARKGIEMFQQVDVPILGLIENMSTHICSSCGHEDPIFGYGGTEEESNLQGVPFLGRLPLDISIRLAGDSGVPIVAQEDAHDSHKKAFKNIIQMITQGIDLK